MLSLWIAAKLRFRGRENPGPWMDSVLMKRQVIVLSRRQEAGAPRSDRRLSPRYLAVKNRAIVAWRTETENCESPAKVLNISNGGALAVCEKRPMRDKPVWLRLGEPVATEWAEAKIVRTVKLPGLLWIRKPSYLIQLCFTEPCPYRLFKSATHGDQLDTEAPEPALPEDDSRYWR
jgi:hypothetical protein